MHTQICQITWQVGASWHSDSSSFEYLPVSAEKQEVKQESLPQPEAVSAEPPPKQYPEVVSAGPPPKQYSEAVSAGPPPKQYSEAVSAEPPPKQYSEAVSAEPTPK